MQLTRAILLEAGKHPIKRLTSIPIFYLIGAIYSLFLEINMWMIFQLIISLWFILAFHFSFSYHKKNKIFNLKTSLKITDIPTIIFSSFVLLYYTAYHGYKLFFDFSWWHLVYVLFSISAGIGLFRQSVSYTVILNNLTQFFDKDTLDLSKEEWNDFLKKWELEEKLPT